MKEKKTETNKWLNILPFVLLIMFGGRFLWRTFANPELPGCRDSDIVAVVTEQLHSALDEINPSFSLGEIYPMALARNYDEETVCTARIESEDAALQYAPVIFKIHSQRWKDPVVEVVYTLSGTVSSPSE